MAKICSCLHMDLRGRESSSAREGQEGPVRGGGMHCGGGWMQKAVGA